MQPTPPDEAASPTVAVGTRTVGPGKPAFVIAEAGVNHNGHLSSALALVDAAARAGADAVKFQLFRANDLVCATAPTAQYQKRATGIESQRAMLERLELSQADFQGIADHCHDRGLCFLATPFAVADVARVKVLNSCAIKIASTDLNNQPLLEAAAGTGLPIILSTGASTRSEIGDCVNGLAQSGIADRLILLHCVSCYPAPLEALNLRAIHRMTRAFNVPVGFSDHSRSTHTGAWAVAAGACVVEKHFTLDRRAKGPDHAMSLDTDELCDYIARLREAETALGDGVVGMTECESEVRSIARKSVVARGEIPAGTLLTTEMLTLKRPGTGIAPDRLRHLIGKRTRLDIPDDSVISWEMVE